MNSFGWDEKPKIELNVYADICSGLVHPMISEILEYLILVSEKYYHFNEHIFLIEMTDQHIVYKERVF